MEITSCASRKMNIAGGAAVLAFLAARAYRPRSGKGMVLKYALLFAALAISIVHVLLQLRRMRSGICGTESGVSPASPRGRGPAGILLLAAEFFGDFLALAGRHAVALIIVSRFDTEFHVLYREYGRIYTAIKRVLVDLAMAEFLVLALARFSVFLKGKPRVYGFFRGAREDCAFLDKWRRVISAAFFVSFAYAYLCRFILTTMYKGLILDDDIFLRILRVTVLAALLIAVWASSAEKRHLVWLLQSFILAVGILHFRDGGKKSIILAMCVFIVAASGKNARTILKISVIGGILCLLVSYISARTGIIGEYIAHTATGGVIEARHTFGVISPTDHAAHLLFIVTASCMLLIRSQERKWYHCLAFLPMLFSYFLAYRYNRARIASFCILLVILITVVRELHAEFLSGRTPKLPSALKRAVTVVFAALSLLYLVFFIWSAYMMRQKDPASVRIPFRSLLASFMDLTSIDHRIEVSQMSFRTYSPGLFGQEIREVGFGGGRNPTLETYTFMDISYVKILFVGGILFTIVILGLMTYIQFKNLREKLYACILLLTVIALDCLFEHHIYELSYNVFPLLAFAVWAGKGALPERRASLRSRKPS